MKGGGAETKKNNVNRIPKITIISMDKKRYCIFLEIRKNSVFTVLPYLILLDHDFIITFFEKADKSIELS